MRRLVNMYPLLRLPCACPLVSHRSGGFSGHVWEPTSGNLHGSQVGYSNPAFQICCDDDIPVGVSLWSSLKILKQG